MVWCGVVMGRRRDVRDEAADQTAIRMLDFLNVCKYQIDDLYVMMWWCRAGGGVVVI